MTEAAEIPSVDPAESSARKSFALPLPGLWIFLACLLLALLCNAGGLRGEGFIGAEQTLVRDNDLLNRLPGLQSIWFRAASPSTYPLPQYAPLAQTMFFVEHTLWGDRIGLYRLVSVILHAAVGLMIWLLMRRLLIPGAIAAALLFVAHPMAVDSVSWIAERRNPLAALLGLSSAFLLLRAAGVIPPSASKLKLLPDDPVRLYAIGALLFVLALFSNAAIATLPLAVLLIAWWKREPGTKADSVFASTCIALLAAGIAMLALSASIERSRAGVSSPAAWNRAPTDAGEFAARVQIAGRAVVFYAQKLIVPYPIAIDYPRWQTPRDVEQFKTFSKEADRAAARKPDVAADDLVSYLFPLAVLAVVIASWVVRIRLGRGQFVVVAGFVLLLAPSLGFIDLGWMRYSFVANHAAYLAVVPALAGLAWLGAHVLSMTNDRTIKIAAAAVVVAAFAVLSLKVSQRFSTPAHFWAQNQRAVTSVRSWWPTYEIAATSLENYDPLAFKAAQEALDLARKNRPDEPAPLVMAGLLKLREGNEVGAIADFEACMQTFPTYAPAYVETADSFRLQADRRPTDPKPRLTAMRLYAEAAERDPFDVRAHLWLGRTSWEVARRLDPKEPSLQQYLDQAAQAFDAAVDLRPYDVNLLIEISRTAVEMGKLGYAGALLERARSINSERADIYVVVADASLARVPPDYAGADASLRLALSLDPQMPAARLRMGRLRQTQERWREAREQFNAVLEVVPNSSEAKQRLAEIDAAATTRPGT